MAHFMEATLSIILLCMGISRFLGAMSLDIQSNLAEIDQETVAAKKRLTPAKVSELETKLLEIIKFHSESLR